jgi:two-component system chemotaxis response regulator CheY
MPEMNGLEVLKAIQNISPFPKVIILTLYDTPEYRFAASSLGADGYVVKSEFIETLLPMIHRLFSQSVSIEKPKETPMKNILIVDDSKTLRKMILASLQRIKGVRFIEAGNGLEAIEKLALFPINLIILDLNMPDMHGMEVLHFIRSHDTYRRIFVIILTTRGDEASRTQALGAGADLYLTKPFNPMDLTNHVAKHLDKERTDTHE